VNRHVITAGHAPAASAVSSTAVVTFSCKVSNRSQVHAVSKVSTMTLMRTSASRVYGARRNALRQAPTAPSRPAGAAWGVRAGRPSQARLAALAKDARASGGAPIVLVAAPRLLGIYRQHLPAALRNKVVLEVKLDLTKLPARELTKRVREAVKTLPLAVTERLATPRRKQVP